MKKPTKAIILAAGFGTRMLPLSCETPKPLLPVWGRPVLGHTLDMLESWGVREVLINLHNTPRPILEYVRAWKSTRLRMNLSYEPEILGSGGTIRRAEWFLDDSCFWMINGDIAVDVTPHPFLKAYRRIKPIAVLWLNETSGPRTVEMSRGLIGNFHSVRRGSAGTYTFCGLQLVSREIIRHIPLNMFSSIIEAYNRAIENGNKVAGVCVPEAFWADIGTPANYLDAHRRILNRYHENRHGDRLLDPQQLKRVAHLRRAGVVVDGFASVGQGVRIAGGVHIRNAVIWDGSVINSGARIENAVVAGNVRIGGRINRIALRAEAIGDSRVVQAIRKLGWPLRNTVALPLAPRGSARDFIRIKYGGRSAIVVRYSLERPENALYVQNARFLRKIGLRVPEVLIDLSEMNLTVIEDVGDRSLLSLVDGKSARSILKSYRSVLGPLLLLHKRGARRAVKAGITLSEPFSPDLYKWEHELFCSHFLIGVLSLNKRVIADIMNDLQCVAVRLMKEPSVLIHRDLQSSNVFFHHGGPVFLDFQGMRFGPAVYDLASLLCDPYVSLPENVQEELIVYYADKMDRSVKISEEIFWWAAIQRLVQAIGAYARLSADRQTAKFKQYIVPSLRMLDRALTHIDGLPHLRKLIRNT